MRLALQITLLMSAVLCGACASAPAPISTPAERVVTVPDRDAREGENLIAIIAEKTHTITELRQQVTALTSEAARARRQAAVATQSERATAAQTQRLEALIVQIQDEQRATQKELLMSRIGLVQANQELYRERIARLVRGEVR